MKTVAISITRGLIVRNILKTDAFEILRKKSDLRFIFLVLDKAVEDFKKEFFGENIEVVSIPNLKTSRPQSLFLKIFSRNLVWTDSAKIISFNGKFSDKKRNSLFHKVLFNTVGFLGKFGAFIKFYRFLDYRFFPENNYDPIFKEKKIDLLFLPDAQGKIETALLKSAKRFGVKAIAMTKGWDTLCQRILRVLPDKIIVQSEPVKNDAFKYQRLPESKIFVSGFPQFDFYHRKEWILSRKDYCSKLGLDHNRAILFFGSSGAWSNHDNLTAKILYESARDNKFIKPCSLILRPHFSNVTHKPYKDFYNLKDVHVDDNYTLCNFIDNWNPSEDDTRMFVNTLHHADVMICYVSTLALDAAVLDKPLVNLVFGGQYDPDGNDVTWRLFKRTHYQQIVKTNGAWLVHNPVELIEAVNRYLENPELDKDGRKKIRDYWCYGSDGKAGLRIADFLLQEVHN